MSPYPPASRFVVPLFAALFAATAIRAQTIETLQPPSIGGHALAFDTLRSTAVLFGEGQTWEFDGAAWNHRAAPVAPSPRWGAGMVFDGARGRILLFGGQSTVGPQVFGDTWEYDGAAWTQITVVTTPPPRRGAGMVFDAQRGRTVLFGGGEPLSASWLQDTWEYDGTNWSQVTTAHSPSPRERMAIAAGAGTTLLFGGYAGFAGGMDDTWTYDGIDWTLRSPALTPLRRYDSAMVFDLQRGRFVMVGGQ
ncbi:MAG: hypothetical protein KDC98_09910, partial [Planctomycetes bacterium]|nr:hypothetical protein [Planctomycetota bacterium]